MTNHVEIPHNSMEILFEKVIWPALWVIATAVIGFLFKNYIKTINDNISKLLNGIDAIKLQVSDIKTDLQLQASAMREVETRVEYRLQGIEKRLGELEKSRSEQSLSIRNLDNFMQKIQIHHNSQHPTDKI